MTPYAIPDADQSSSLITRAAAQLLQQMRAVLGVVEDRRAVLHLAEADDRFLKDIGLLRSDVDGALAEPFYRKSSVLLVRLAERRARAEAARTAQASHRLHPEESCVQS